VGSLLKRKGVHVLLAAAALLPATRNWYVLIVGDGPEKQSLWQQAVQLGIEEKVIFAGFQPDPLSYIAASDACISCSASEGFPLIILEAMLLAKPMIASDVNGSRELVQHQKTGVLIPYDDAECLAKMLLDVMDNPEIWQQRGHAGGELVRAEYTINNFIKGIEQVIQEELCSTS
jgi:glycosyltransferase involved in cell wall biosynthesis